MSMIPTHPRWGTVDGVTREPTEFGRVLRRLRAYRSLSQSALARRAGINHAHVSRMESGARTVTQEMVRAIADALDATAMERGELMVTAGFIPDDSRDLLLTWARVPADLRARLLAVIEAVAEEEEAA